MIKEPSKIRSYAFILLTLVLIIKAISDAWFPVDDRVISSNFTKEETVLSESLEEKTLLIQLKIALGSLNYFRKKSKEFTAETFPLKDFEDTLKISFSDGALKEYTKKELLGDADLQIYIKKYAFAKHLDLIDPSTKYKDLALSIQTSRPYLKTAQSVIDALENKKELSLSKEDKDLLSHLGIFSKLLLAELEESTETNKEIAQIAENFFMKFIVGISFALLFAILCIICFIFYSYKIFSKTIVRKSSFKKEYSNYGLEIFCIYLASMLFLPKLITFFQKQGFVTNGLLANILCITPLVLLVFWPTLFAVPFKKIRELVGIQLDSVRGTIKDLIIGPTAYLAYWVILLSVLVIYSIVMMRMGVDTEQSAHPIVPILSETKEQINIIYIMLLAVVVAPLVEEVMFRGALYSWFRARFGVFVSVLSSSFIFAAIHPQGAVGVVPLTCIGILLALLREWRGSLVAPIIAHACFNAGTLIMVLFIFR